MIELKLSDLFNCSEAKILEQTQIFGNMEQTISMLAESTGTSYKTVQSAIKKLEKAGIVVKTRKIGNAQAYRFDTEKLQTLIKFMLDSEIVFE